MRVNPVMYPLLPWLGVTPDCDIVGLKNRLSLIDHVP